MRLSTPTLFLFGLFGLGLSRMADACCAVAGKGEPVVNADQTVILLWDRERQTEHFIRKASFKSEGDSVGFIVPTPSRPQLEESGNAAFPYLAQITAPQVESKGMPIGCAVESPTTSYSRSVRVIEEKTVAGYDAVVLAADSGKALVAWLKDHGYAYTPEAEEWAQPYLEKGWYMTAMKIAKDAGGKAAPAVAASALRITFKTDRPLFPYREPDSRKDAAKLHVSNRLLRIYFVAESRYEGRFPESQAWGGKPRWSAPLREDQRSGLLKHLGLAETTGPSKAWLTEFEDHWAYGKAPGDVYFSPSANQKTIARESGGFVLDPTLAVALGVFLVRPLFRRRTAG
jgi:hypothetical protein